MNPAASDLQPAAAWLPAALATACGACVGSFLNVVIVRSPAGESLVRPGSHCACGAPIAWRDKIPLLSWALLRGRARCCGRAISPRYPAVEALTALLFLAAWLRLPPAEAACGWVFLSFLVAGSFIDAEHQLLPDGCTLGLAAAGVGLSLLVPGLHGEAGGPRLLASLRSAGDGVAGLAAGSGLLLWIALPAEALLKKEAMGFGDVKLIGAIGAFCGWRGAVFSIFGGAVLGAVGIATLLAVGRLSARGSLAGLRVPFGPLLAAASAVYFLFLRSPVDAWFGQFLAVFQG